MLQTNGLLDRCTKLCVEGTTIELVPAAPKTSDSKPEPKEAHDAASTLKKLFPGAYLPSFIERGEL